MDSKNNLWELLQETDISISQLAREIGINRATLYSHLQDNAEYKGAVLIKLADYFGVTTDYLLGRTKIKH